MCVIERDKYTFLHSRVEKGRDRERQSERQRETERERHEFE